MTLLKVMTAAIAAMVTILAASRLMSEMQAAKVRVRTDDRARRRAVTRLRQDPRTGIYYPES
jgi:hypothetical protein